MLIFVANCWLERREEMRTWDKIVIFKGAVANHTKIWNAVLKREEIFFAILFCF
jgi:hypothetical protein